MLKAVSKSTNTMSGVDCLVEAVALFVDTKPKVRETHTDELGALIGQKVESLLGHLTANAGVEPWIKEGNTRIAAVLGSLPKAFTSCSLLGTAMEALEALNRVDQTAIALNTFTEKCAEATAYFNDGIMLDDVVVGVVTNFLVNGLKGKTSWKGLMPQRLARQHVQQPSW